MLFSPENMNKYFTSEKLPIARGRPQAGAPMPVGTPTQVIRSKRFVHDWFNMFNELQKDGMQGARLAYFQREHSSSWFGTGSQPIPDILQTGIITEAVKAFEQAIGNMDTHYARSAPILSPVGGSFSVGRVMMGHPKAAIIRPKSKLPPKQIALTINVWAGVSPDAIALSMSKIAKAAWQYISAGGIVELTVSFLHNFTQPQVWNDVAHHAFLDTVKINPVNAAAYASAASGQFYRAMSMPLGSVLSGDMHDGLPLGQWCNPLSYPIAGNASDARALEALKIT